MPFFTAIGCFCLACSLQNYVVSFSVVAKHKIFLYINPLTSKLFFKVEGCVLQTCKKPRASQQENYMYLLQSTKPKSFIIQHVRIRIKEFAGYKAMNLWDLFAISYTEDFLLHKSAIL